VRISFEAQISLFFAHFTANSSLFTQKNLNEFPQKFENTCNVENISLIEDFASTGSSHA
jgi:hypothetical protein